MTKLKIRKGDKVVVLSGSDAGKQGEVQKVLPAESKVVVSGVNVVSKHQKPTKESEGGIFSKELPVHVSNVAIVDPKEGKATKVGYKTENGKKVRFAKLSGEIIDKEGK